MTVTRRGLWLSQLLHPEVSHVVAFGLTLSGPLDAERLHRTAGAVLDHVGWYDVRLSPNRSPADGHPHPLQPAGSGLDPVECVDLSACADPAAESEALRSVSSTTPQAPISDCRCSAANCTSSLPTPTGGSCGCITCSPTAPASCG